MWSTAARTADCDLFHCPHYCIYFLTMKINHVIKTYVHKTVVRTASQIAEIVQLLGLCPDPCYQDSVPLTADQTFCP